MNKKRVVIIGAGIAGISVAYFLNMAGRDVTILDKTSGSDNCSYGNAGMIVPSHIIPLASPGMIAKGLKWMLNPESPFYIRPRFSTDLFRWGWLFYQASTKTHVKNSAPVLKKLLMTSRELLIQIEEDESLEFGYVKNGLFMFCNSQKGLAEESRVAEMANRLGMAAEVLTAQEVEAMEPALKMDILGATYYPQDAHLHPGWLMDGLKNALSDKGVRFEFNTEIKRFQVQNQRIISAIDSDGKNWGGTEFVISSGVWSSTLANTIGIQCPMQAGKGYSISLDQPNRMRQRPRHCGIFAEEKVTMTPMENSLRFGGTMEITGNDNRLNPKKIKGLKKSVCRYMPEFKPEDLEGYDIWRGLRPCSPDGMPYAGSFKDFENLYTSTGHAMMGMSLAPSCGKLVADLITQGGSDLQHPLIDPNRYQR
ncbi:MAG: FAD-dependent oxidoreductase [Balneolaceae bacterium]